METCTCEAPGTCTVTLTEKFYSDDPADTLGFHGGVKEKVDCIHATEGVILNPSLHVTVKPSFLVTPKIALVKPGITLEKEKPGIIDPIGPVSSEIGTLQKQGRGGGIDDRSEHLCYERALCRTITR